MISTEKFLKHVLPKQGVKILGINRTFQKNNKAVMYQEYRDYPTIGVMAEKATDMSDDGETIYFAVNAFEGWYQPDPTKKPKIRRQENVVACRSLYEDFDVDPDDPKKYQNRQEALEDLKKLARILNVVPTVTSSGGGFHMYITCHNDMTPEEWQELSDMKRAVCKHLKLKVDYAVHCDSARVLRPVGTNNHKYDPPKPVVCKSLGRLYTRQELYLRIDAYIQANSLEVRQKGAKEELFNPFGAAVERDYPDVIADKVADKCAVIKMFRDEPEKMLEPEWYNAIGIVSKCVDGEQIVHDWSSGYEGYTYDETQTKIEQWTDLGPATCEKIDESSECREDCPYKVTTPMQLGIDIDSPSKETPTVVEDLSIEDDDDEVKQGTGTVIEGEQINHWPRGVRWDGTSITMAKADDDGGVTFIPFCRSLVYPVMRVRDGDGAWHIKMRALDKAGRWHNFLMPTEELARMDLMCRTLSKYEVFVLPNNKAKTYMTDFLHNMVERLQKYKVETKSYKQLGWDDEGGFVIGTQRILENDEEEIICADDVSADARLNFGQSGTLEEWVSNMDIYLNRAGAEVEQLVLCHVMGSVLIEVMGFESWHGLPMAIVGTGSAGKSSMSQMALTFYGAPKHMFIQSTNQGTTLAGAIRRVSSTGCIPLVLDEFTKRTPDEFSSMGYALANGKDKIRLRPDGKEASDGTVWFKNSVVTSNNSVYDEISKLPPGYITEATQLRFFEIPMKGKHVQNVFPELVGTNFIDNHINNTYGTAVRKFVRAVMKSHTSVKRQLNKNREKLHVSVNMEASERFYRDLLATAYTAGQIAKKLGLINFDIENMLKKSIKYIHMMRDSRKASQVDMPEYIAQFIASLNGRTIVTNVYGKETVPYPPRKDPIARVATKDKLMYVTHAGLKDWCVERNITMRDMEETLEANGFVKRYSNGKLTSRIYIGKGTDIASAQARCYAFNYDKVFSEGNVTIEKDDDGNPKDIAV